MCSIGASILKAIYIIMQAPLFELEWLHSDTFTIYFHLNSPEILWKNRKKEYTPIKDTEYIAVDGQLCFVVAMKAIMFSGNCRPA